MTDFLQHLVTRFTGAEPASRPRLPSLFEPLSMGLETASQIPPEIETTRWLDAQAEPSVAEPEASATAVHPVPSVAKTEASTAVAPHEPDHDAIPFEQPGSSRIPMDDPPTAVPVPRQPVVADQNVTDRAGTNESDVSESDVSEPDVSEPDVSEPDVSEPVSHQTISLEHVDHEPLAEDSVERGPITKQEIHQPLAPTKPIMDKRASVGFEKTTEPTEARGEPASESYSELPSTISSPFRPHPGVSLPAEANPARGVSELKPIGSPRTWPPLAEPELPASPLASRPDFPPTRPDDSQPVRTPAARSPIEPAPTPPDPEVVPRRFSDASTPGPSSTARMEPPTPQLQPPTQSAGLTMPFDEPTHPAMVVASTQPAAPQTTVNVMIGRVEVTASPAPAKPRRTRKPSAVMTLEAYLRQSAAGGGG